MGLIEPYTGKFSSILLFGPPGAGKALLGKFLASAGSQYYLSSIDIFLKLASYSPAGKLFHSYASRGQLLPDEETVEIWKYYVQGLIATNAYYPESQDLLLDGVPRTLSQAMMLDEYINVRHVIVLEAHNENELLQRVSNRARMEGRFDEIDPSLHKARLETYKEEIAKILPHYSRHLVSHVNAEQRPLEVLRDVLVRLSHVLSKSPRKMGQDADS